MTGRHDHDAPARPAPRSLGLDGLQRLLAERDPLLIEVLGPDDYRWAHLPGAFNVPLDQIGTQLPADIDPARPVVAYCNDFL